MRLSKLTALGAVLFFALAAGATVAPAQSARERVDGVTNFGRVTETYFRGGKVTPAGVENLYNLGVRTIIDLRDEPSPGEPEACEQLGITYHKVPLSGHAAPDSSTVDRVLSIIKDSKTPVYVHCSAGKHRAGTIGALYRMRVQGWSEEKAWEEQQAYGFGPRQAHLELFEYAYGTDGAGAGATTDVLASVSMPVSTFVGAAAAPAQAVAALSPSAGYVSMKDVVAKARKEGGTGDIMQIDLEYDITRSSATWDVTFSSGNEYEFDATTGAFVGVKPKAASKIAKMLPIGDVAKSFHDIMSAAEASAKQPVMEMELKHIKGTDRAVYEVVFADGQTVYHDANSGSKIDSM